jgi:probable HAF family extracellular repeat protein
VASFNSHAAIWAAGSTVQDLGTLGGDFSSAYSINSQGKVVGFSEVTRGGDVHAYVWAKATGMKDLGTLAGGNYSIAQAISSHGLIAGTSNLSNGDLHAVLWTPTGKLMDLGGLGGVTTYATGINSAGQVVGYSDLQ